MEKENVIHEENFLVYVHHKHGFQTLTPPKDPDSVEPGSVYTKSLFAKVLVDDENNYTMCLVGVKGGPIVSDKTLDAVRSKFKDALQLSLSVGSLLSFAKKNEGKDAD